jgi:1,4-dihydroxy-2-naphthoate octaprenyltransferase
MRLDRERLKRAVPWQAAVLMAALSLLGALIFIYVRDWWGVIFVIAANIALCAQAYYYEGKNRTA